jgi:hypothetical protein
LKAVADSKHQPSGKGKFFDFLHQGREASDGSGPEIVSIRESSWEDNTVCVLKVMLFMPEKKRLLFQNFLDCIQSVMVTVRAWENHHPESHLRGSSSVRVIIP